MQRRNANNNPQKELHIHKKKIESELHKINNCQVALQSKKKVIRGCLTKPGPQSTRADIEA